MSDVDFPSVFSDEIRTARKEHKCCECPNPILPGQKYHLFKGCYEGKWSRYKTCMDCDEIWAELRNLYRDDECPAFGELHEWAHESGMEFPLKVEATP